MKKIISICLLFIGVTSYGQWVNEEQAIKQLLERESSTWRSGDAKGHADCWKIQPYSRIVISTADGKMFEVPPATMANPPASMLGKGGTFANSNYKISVMGNSAWVSHNEESVSKDGKKSYSVEFKMLEKI